MPVPEVSDPLAGPPRLRSVVAGEHPYPGVVVAGDPARLWVDADDFRDGPAWQADPDGHVLAPFEIARTPTGHAVVLPLCAGTLRDAVARRAPLTPGEIVTVAVSLLRGAVEAGDLGAVNGQWWVTDAGRPVLALTGAADWRPATAGLFALLAEDQHNDVVAALARCADTVADPRLLARDAEGCEHALFALAEPAALGTRLVPVLVRDLTAPAPVDTPAPPGVVELVARWVDAGLADRLRMALRRRSPVRHAPGERTPAAPRATRRRAPWLLGAGLAAAILVTGLLWPAEAPVGATPAPRATPSGTGTPTGPAGSSPPVATSEDPLVLLVDDLARCVAAPCGATDPREDPARPVPAGIASTPGAPRRITVLDDYGGVSVLRVEGAEGDVPPQIVVIVRDEEKWLVRDVYDVADQP